MSNQPERQRPATGDAAMITRRRFSLARLIYGVYAWIAFACCAVFALLAVLLLPGVSRRRYWVTRFAQAPFILAGVPVTIEGAGKLPSSPCIVVANHASYIDGVILQAFLPPRFSYVIKGEMKNVPVIGFLLRRIGAHFVDRNTVGRSARDARTLLRAADNGDSLAFFPEGTFLPRPGLGAFRGGAFAASLRTRSPLVPVVIHGTRQLLPATTLLPARTALRVEILDPLDPAKTPDAKQLAELARQRILAVLDEPDLLAEEHDRN